jgi:hypothetical protein
MDEPADEAPKAGSRVQVQNVDGSDLGFGTYMGEIPLKHIVDDSPSADAVSVEVEGERDPAMESALREMIDDGETTPKIILDSGKTLYGFECWWQPVEENSTAQ